MRGCSGGGVRGCSQGGVAPRGCAWLLPGGTRGCSGGCAWLLWGACVVAPRGGMHGCSRGDMRGCSWGACMVALGGRAWLLLGGGGVRGFFDEIRSMSGRYASYWNPFLFVLTSTMCGKNVSNKSTPIRIPNQSMKKIYIKSTSTKQTKLYLPKNTKQKWMENRS